MPIDQDAFHDQWGTGGASAPADETGTRTLDPGAFASQWLASDEKPATKESAAQNPVTEGAGNLAGGFGKGVMDVVNTGAQGIGYLTNGVTKFLADRGISNGLDVKTEKERFDTLNKRIEQENKNYEAKRGDSWMASGGRLGGQLLASAPTLAVGGEAIPAGVAGLKVVAPSLVKAAEPYATSLLARLGIVGPIEGAIGGGSVGATTSAASPEPVGQQIKEGATTGAILGPLGPAAYEGGKYVGNAVKGLVAPFTEGGQSNLATGTVSKLAAPQPQVLAHEIIPGSKPTLAEATADPGIATLQRQARDLNPAPFVAKEAENSLARTNYLNKVTGTTQDIDAAKAHLDQEATHAVNTLFKPGQAADSAPVVAEIDSILSGKGGKRDAVQQVLTNLRSKIVNKDGSLESDPEVLYNSVRKQIGDMLDKSPANSPAGNQAKRELMQVRDVLDDRITKAVPGFDSYLADYSAAARPIDAMKYLQGLNLTDSKGNITLAKVDSALKGIQKQQQAGGINPAKSLDTSHIDALTKLREDLLRSQNTQLGISKGSPTFQNIATNSMLQGLLPGKVGTFAGKIDPTYTGGAIGTAIGGALGGPIPAAVGSVLGGFLGHSAGEVMKGKNAQVMSKIEELLLNPHSFNPANVMQGGKNLPVNRALSRGAGGIGSRLVAAPAINQSP